MQLNFPRTLQSPIHTSYDGGKNLIEDNLGSLSQSNIKFNFEAAEQRF